MKVISGRARLPAELGRPLRAPAVAIGNFDGVHRGHQALIAAARDAAAAQGGEAVVLTFDPHPARFFAPDLAPPMLMSLPRRLELLGEAGASCAIVEPFDAALAATTAEAFAADLLLRDVGAAHVVVGYDFSFGRGRQGTTATLAALGARLGFGVTVVPQVTVNGIVCSSTRVRELVLEGRVEGAKLLLGRPFEMEGIVVHGAGRGRKIGVPTANVQPEGELLPKTGVYAALVRLHDGAGFGAAQAAAVNVGTNPTFTGTGTGSGSPVIVEAHVLGYTGADFYGRRVRVEPVARLRDERRFAGVDELVRQIHGDIARTREIFT